MAFPFDSDIESSLIFGCGFGEDFFTAGGLSSLTSLETHHQQLLAFWLLVLALRKSKELDELWAERSANPRVRRDMPELVTRLGLSFFLSIRSGI
jgi:hypothetical protein